MAAQPVCPNCLQLGRKGMNCYTRDDGTVKCRTCGNIFVQKSEQKTEEPKDE